MVAATSFIHYRPDDGEILGWGYGCRADADRGAWRWPMSSRSHLIPTVQKFDGEAVIDKTAQEQRLSRLPKLIEVQQAIWIELGRTDDFVLADYPIPRRGA